MLRHKLVFYAGLGPEKWNVLFGSRLERVSSAIVSWKFSRFDLIVLVFLQLQYRNDAVSKSQNRYCWLVFMPQTCQTRAVSLTWLDKLHSTRMHRRVFVKGKEINYNHFHWSKRNRGMRKMSRPQTDECTANSKDAEKRCVIAQALCLDKCRIAYHHGNKTEFVQSENCVVLLK